MERQELAIEFVFCLVLIEVLTKVTMPTIPQTFVCMTPGLYVEREGGTVGWTDGWTDGQREGGIDGLINGYM